MINRLPFILSLQPSVAAERKKRAAIGANLLEKVLAMLVLVEKKDLQNSEQCRSK